MSDPGALPHDMRAAVLSADGVVRVERIPVPVPRAGEALLRVEACGLCHTDVHVLKGEVAFPTPCVLGHEVSGVVVALEGDGGRGIRVGDGNGEGDGGRGIRVGDRVVGGFIMPCTECAACLAGRDDLCERFFSMNRLKGTLYDGESRLARADGETLAMYSMAGMAEYCVSPVSGLVPLPDGLPFDASAVLGCAAMTAYGAVARAAELRPGATVAVVATGGVGMSVVQIARALGAARVIAVDIDTAKLELAMTLGATDVVDSRDADPVAAVRALTGGRGVDVAFEALGRPQTFEQASRMLADGGRLVAIGIAAGAATAAIEITPLVRRGQQIVGSFGARTRVDLPAVVGLAASGAFDLERSVTRRYDLDDVARAFGDLAAGRILGRAVVRMS
ncbi:zinc-binding dehydrogenase [Herbiconiux daphne]|uniref:Zinc-binding dehydrogenase n=1 Tax=Herbiconiux daphne TaxID=2970914 RepID=A0ABT2H4D1_9MICO|nr:zinc-binding dehydrogenase [Herbiconiux daphne]MCS5734783.1 zinc-binding dehydrogenase [Herbiconiux daphne]